MCDEHIIIQRFLLKLSKIRNKLCSLDTFYNFKLVCGIFENITAA